MSGRTFILSVVVLAMLIAPGLFAGDAIAGNVILYDRDGNIYAADIDGSNERQLTSGAQADYMPSISPDGTTIAFSRGYDLYLMNQDGGDQRLLVSKGDVGNNNVHDSDWTIDGEWIYFNAVSGCCSGGLYKVRPDGTGLTQVKSGYISGTRIRKTFGDRVIFNQRRSGLSYSQNVRITDLDGGSEEQVTGGSSSESSATFGTCWSPDGQRFAYNYGHQHIYVADYPAPYNPVEVKTFDSWHHSLEWLDNNTLIWIDAYDAGPMHALNVDTLEDTDLGIEGNFPYVGGRTIPVTPMWWDESWSYRKPLTITNNVEAVLYDYSMKISLNTAHLIAQGKMQGDCGDIRIVENGEELSYGIRDCNSANTEIYFIANDVAVGDNNDIYIYYGNPDADDGFVENWKDAFYIWYDDFDTDRGWDNCPGYEDRHGSVTVDTVNGWLYATYGAYMDYWVCPTDGSSFPMNGRVGFKAETRIMAENDNWCQIQIELGDSNSVPVLSVLDFRVGHNDYHILWDSFVPKNLDDDVWYEATAVYNRLTGNWHGEFANDGTRSGTRPAQVDDDFSIIMLDICNGINMYLDYLYLRYFIEPEPGYALGAEEAYSDVGCPHDECADAIAVEANEPYNGTTIGAIGTETSSCAYEDHNDVWHSFTPDYDYEYAISLCGSAFDTTLAVFDECGGTELACNDDTKPGVCSSTLQSQLTMSLAKGSTYLIRIAGFAGATGDYILMITGPKCLEYPAMDFDHDCKVGLRDLAIFCQSWLECNLDPPDLCGQ